jgi:hypothetical protein
VGSILFNFMRSLRAVHSQSNEKSEKGREKLRVIEVLKRRVSLVPRGCNECCRLLVANSSSWSLVESLEASIIFDYFGSRRW